MNTQHPQHPPQLPNNISSNGEEIFDWAGKMSIYVLNQDKISRLKKDIAACGKTCGDCDKWMKSRECPKEKPGTGNRRGYSVGPSCTDYICKEYVESIETTKRRERLQNELKSFDTQQKK